MHVNTLILITIGAWQMFFRKSKEIKELKSLLSIFYERNKIQTNLIRVHLNTNQRLREEIKRLKEKEFDNVSI